MSTVWMPSVGENTFFFPQGYGYSASRCNTWHKDGQVDFSVLPEQLGQNSRHGHM